MGRHLLSVPPRAPSRARWRDWVACEPVLAGFGRWGLLDALADRSSDPDRVDPVLAALARLARHDRESGGLLVAVLAPEITGLARRYARTLGYDEAAAIAVAAIWDRVARFEPPASHVAYRLRWLAGRQVHLAALRQRDTWARACPVDGAVVAVGQDADPGLSSALLLGDAVRAGVISGSDAWLIHATEITGHSVGYAARRLGLGYDNAKKRRQRAEHRLAGWLDPEGPRLASRDTVA